MRTHKAAPDRTVPPIVTFLRTFLFLSLVFSIWSVATPLMAFPDEPAHTIKAAAVVRGQILIDDGTSFGHGVHVRVPSYIANLHAQDCYKFRADKTADCAPAIPGDDIYETIGVTSAGSYNPMYYWIVGLPSLILTGSPALYGMRLVSALLSAAFYAAGFTALTRLRQPKFPMIFAGLAMTPMVLFLASGINPNSLEIAATMAAFAGFVVTLDNVHRLSQVVPAIVTVVASTIVLANTRQVSLVWLLCAFASGIALFQRHQIAAAFKSRLIVTGMLLAVPGVLLGLLWIYLMLHAPANAGVAPEGIANPQPDVPIYRAFLTMLEKSPEFIPQYIGVMGWLDTPVPMVVIVFWCLIFAVTLLLPLMVKPRRIALGYWVALALLIIVPALLQTSLWRSMGFIWQGRYNLPLVVVLFMSVGMIARLIHLPTDGVTKTAARVMMGALAACQILSFVYVLRRYVVGVFEVSSWPSMISKPEWQPPFGWVVLTILYSALMLAASYRVYGLLFPGSTLFSVRRFRALGTTRDRLTGAKDRATSLTQDAETLLPESTDSSPTGPRNHR